MRSRSRKLLVRRTGAPPARPADGLAGDSRGSPGRDEPRSDDRPHLGAARPVVQDPKVAALAKELMAIMPKPGAGLQTLPRCGAGTGAATRAGHPEARAPQASPGSSSGSCLLGWRSGTRHRGPDRPVVERKAEAAPACGSAPRSGCRRTAKPPAVVSGPTGRSWCTTSPRGGNSCGSPGRNSSPSNRHPLPDGRGSPATSVNRDRQGAGGNSQGTESRPAR